MKEAMWRVAPLGDYRFSDRIAGQEVLFGEEIHAALLQSDLLNHFAGSTVSIGDIERYVLEHTPYLKSHIKRQTLRPMQVDGRISSPNQSRRNQYPDGTLITFADGPGS